MANRKLFRPSLSDSKEGFQDEAPVQAQELAGSPSNPARPRREHPQPGPPPRGQSSGSNYRRRPTPPDQTAAEAFYYLKQMNTQTPMVVVLDDGEQLRGHIEWYDRHRMCSAS